jgi:hypothetical protein
MQTTTANSAFQLRANKGGFDAAISTAHPYFASHMVRGKTVFPGVACLDLALEALRAKYPSFNARGFEDCLWTTPTVGTGEQVVFRIHLGPDGAKIRFEIWNEHAKCATGWITGSAERREWTNASAVLEEIACHPSRRFNRQQTYEAFSGMGIEYGNFFRRINYVDVYKNLAVALLSSNDGTAMVFTNLLDCAFQAGVAISIGKEQASLMPFSLGSLSFHGSIDFENAGTFLVATEKSTPFRTNIAIFSKDDELLISVMDLGVKASRL